MVFVKILRDYGIILGIKVDKGVVFLVGIVGESIIQGFDGLFERCVQYKKDGCDFVKWCCVLKIGLNQLFEFVMKENVNVFVCYVSICQVNGFVLIVEFEVLCDGDYFLE